MTKHGINQERELTTLIDRDTILRFVKLVEDENPIHTNREIAESYDFKDTPIPGTLLHAYFEQLTLDSEFKPKDYALKFANAAYPDEPLTFRKTSEGEGKLELECLNSEGKLVASCSSKSSSSIGKEVDGKLIASDYYEISERRRNSFYGLLDIAPNEKIPISLVSSSIPSSLLGFLFGKTGNYEGIYRRINFNLHSTPKFGDLKTDIHFKKMRSIGDNFIYDIVSECFQDRKRVLSSNVKVTTNLDLKIS